MNLPVPAFRQNKKYKYTAVQIQSGMKNTYSCRFVPLCDIASLSGKHEHRQTYSFGLEEKDKASALADRLSRMMKIKRYDRRPSTTSSGWGVEFYESGIHITEEKSSIMVVVIVGAIEDSFDHGSMHHLESVVCCTCDGELTDNERCTQCVGFEPEFQCTSCAESFPIERYGARGTSIEESRALIATQRDSVTIDDIIALGVPFTKAREYLYNKSKEVGQVKIIDGKLRTVWGREKCEKLFKIKIKKKGINE